MQIKFKQVQAHKQVTMVMIMMMTVVLRLCRRRTEFSFNFDHLVDAFGLLQIFLTLRQLDTSWTFIETFLTFQIENIFRKSEEMLSK